MPLDYSTLSDEDLAKKVRTIKKPKTTPKLNLSQLSDRELEEMVSLVKQGSTRQIQAIPPQQQQPGGREHVNPLTIGQDVISMGLTSAITGQPLKELGTKYSEDKDYIPSEALAESIIPSKPGSEILRPLGQAAIQTGAELLDPLNLLSAGATKPLAKGLKPAAKALKYIETQGAKAAGRIGETFSLGLTTSKGMEKAVTHFSPAQQFRATKTFRNIARDYGGKRDILKAAYLGRPLQGVEKTTLKNLAEQVTPVQLPPAWDETILKISQSVDDLKIQNQPNRSLRKLLQRMEDIKKEGNTSGPELDHLLQTIDKMQHTPLRNEKALYNEAKDALHSARGTFYDLYNQSDEAMATSRSLTSAAAAMISGRKGGALSDMARRSLEYSAIRQAISTAAMGDTKGMTAALAVVFAHSPKFWNTTVATLRVPTFIVRKGAEGTAQYIASNPATANLMAMSLTEAAQNNPELEAFFKVSSQDMPEPIREFLGGDQDLAQPKLSQVEELFINTASDKPSLYQILAQYASSNGNELAGQFFYDASTVGIEQAMGQWQAQTGDMFPQFQNALLNLSKGALKSNPRLRTEMRLNILNSTDMDAPDKSQLINSLNDNSLFKESNEATGTPEL